MTRCYCNVVVTSICILYREPWWLHRGDFEVNNKPNNGSEGLYDVVSDGDSQSNDGQCCDRKTARFTEYSMTSSVIPRSEGMIDYYRNHPHTCTLFVS